MSRDFMGINSWFWPRMFRQSVKIFNELFGDADLLPLTLISFSNSWEASQPTLYFPFSSFFACSFLSMQPYFHVLIQLLFLLFRLFFSLLLIIFIWLFYMDLLTGHIEIWQETGWEWGGVTHSKGCQAGTRTQGRPSRTKLLYIGRLLYQLKPTRAKRQH